MKTRKIYQCYVWHENFGHDSYLVCDADLKEAKEELGNRLDNETIYPAREWHILSVKEVKD